MRWQSLLSGQADAREAHLSSRFGALIEEASLAKRLGTEPLFAEDSYTAESLSNRAGELDRQANQVSEWLHAMTGRSSRNLRRRGWTSHLREIPEISTGT